MLTSFIALAAGLATAGAAQPAKSFRQGMIIRDEPPAHCAPGPKLIADRAPSPPGVILPVWPPGVFPEARVYAPVERQFNGCPVPTPIGADPTPGGLTR